MDCINTLNFKKFTIIISICDVYVPMPWGIYGGQRTVKLVFSVLPQLAFCCYDNQHYDQKQLGETRSITVVLNLLDAVNPSFMLW